MIANVCPVCRAGFRGSRICSRCGADLGPLMRFTAQAWHLRRQARRALQSGDPQDALALADRAATIQSTESGEALRLLARLVRGSED